MMKSDLVFVYGTLKSQFDGEYAVFLRKNATLLGEATCGGYLYLISWYPGLVLSPNGIVTGELYQINNTSDSCFWNTLDEYEGVGDAVDHSGEEYSRRLIEIEMGGKTYTAWAYVYIRPVSGQPLIDGRFLPQ